MKPKKIESVPALEAIFELAPLRAKIPSRKSLLKLWLFKMPKRSSFVELANLKVAKLALYH